MVLADGCFDPLHIGHIRYLEQAALLGGTVMVRVAPDDAILEKGRVPFQSQEERAQMLLAIGVVDRVCCQATLAQAILEFRPRYLVKGEDWRGTLPADVLAACQQSGTDIILTETQAKTSTERLRG